MVDKCGEAVVAESFNHHLAKNKHSPVAILTCRPLGRTGETPKNPMIHNVACLVCVKPGAQDKAWTAEVFTDGTVGPWCEQVVAGGDSRGY